MVRGYHPLRANRFLARFWIAIAAIAAMFALPETALANEINPVCHGYPRQGESYEVAAARPGFWTCSDSKWSADADRVLLRYELGQGQVVPDRIVTRLARFGHMTVGIIGLDGKPVWHAVALDSFRPFGHMKMAAQLPGAGTRARAVMVEFNDPTLIAQLSMARLEDGAHTGFGPAELYLAALCGLLVAPLLFNIAFYGVLRERFLLWHGLVVGCMLAQIVVTSGLVQLVGGLPIGLVSYLVVTTFCGGTAAAVMLAVHFIEDDRLDPRHRSALRIAAAWIMLNGALFVISIDQFQQAAVRLYYAAWIPVIAVVVWTLTVALRRRSRAVWFQIIAWTPMILVGAGRILANVSDWVEVALLYRAQDIAISIEVVVISLGIIDRFVGLRRDLDRQRRKASRLEELVERDPLTGLLNRRAIEPRFNELRAEGFSTFAVLDLDLFKQINDRFGHDVGDRVLQSAARALASTDDMLSMRLGGEEFVLMLRGQNAVQRAEWCRKAIPSRVAAEVGGLDRLVTASMGLLEIPGHVMANASFASIYSRADGLLYQAKRGGRNRLVCERLTSFDGHRRPRKGDLAA